jgi:thiosulfate/3-mercaptopyruvate sulfurtransferase
LNGGLIAWNAAGLPMESGAVSLAPLQYPDRVADDAQVATTEEIERHVETHDAAGGVRKSVLLDARAAARFRGEVEPIDPIAGHVPGALNLEFADLLDADGRFLSPDRLALRFSEVIGRGGASVAEDSIITMCGSGVTACHLLAGLAIAGRGGRLYVGSWSEWIRDSRRPVVRDN